ncbi:flp pilus-assembly TadE/G-like family protein [Nocardia higoensis]|uniref:Flp pilus-assembly TadE/G-like family protein n=1 Tax=Nocardia higoensis TaxID=228599 RepID=A0ABS0DB55_9NOCA|nr:Rv3654c family TadE-like protein [Nocardia higoensis]MBF6355669.1 flp pilus-assembly TadE/G-like family protein [Nocardia higoensis]
MDRGGDKGAATVFACIALVGLIAVTSMLVNFGAVVVARHRAQAGADLGALAAAGVLDNGTDHACARAAAIVRRMGGSVTACEVVGWEVTVSVEGNVSAGVLGDRIVRASARAGPAH